MNSGIEIGPNIIAEYKQCAMKGKYRYIIYKPSEDSSAIEIQKIGDIEETFQDFKDSVEPTSSQ